MLLVLVATLVAGCGTGLFYRSVEYFYYPVSEGDTLSTIGSQFNVGIHQLVEFNDINDPDHLMVGQVLKIPYSGQALPNAEASPKKNPSSYSGLGSWWNSAGHTLVLGSAGRYVGKLHWPVISNQRTTNSKFGQRWNNFHEGIDISLSSGTPVIAAHAGVVAYCGVMSGYGKVLVLAAEDILTVYAHNRRNKVNVGQHINAGEVIAEVGATGNASGPHLHFETRIRSRGGWAAVNPLVFFPDNN